MRTSFNWDKQAYSKAFCTLYYTGGMDDGKHHGSCRPPKERGESTMGERRIKKGAIKEFIKLFGGIVGGVGLFFVIYWLMWLVIGG